MTNGEKISRAKKGKLCKHNGVPMTGKNHPSWRGGLVKIKCLNCGEEFSVKKALLKPYYHRGTKKWIKRRYCSRECMAEYFSENYSGKNHSCWKGGRKGDRYPVEFNEKLKEKIRNRDKNICQRCGRTKKAEYVEFKRKLHVHHIDYNTNNCDPMNLITLCIRCNSEVNADRIKWIEYFKNILDNRI